MEGTQMPEDAGQKLVNNQLAKDRSSLSEGRGGSELG
jgi:hypothetical protein